MTMMFVRPAALLLALILPHSVLAVGTDEDEPPTPTATTTECPDGAVYDTEAEACVVIQDSGLGDDALYDAARELAYAGRLSDALTALLQMSNPDESRVQTYLGFVYRQLGDHPRARTHYAAALAADPDNMLARSYLGMAHLADGEIDLARVQLQEIRVRGAAGSWPDRALSRAIRTGNTIDY